MAKERPRMSRLLSTATRMAARGGKRLQPLISLRAALRVRFPVPVPTVARRRIRSASFRQVYVMGRLLPVGVVRRTWASENPARQAGSSVSESTQGPSPRSAASLGTLWMTCWRMTPSRLRGSGMVTAADRRRARSTRRSVRLLARGGGFGVASDKVDSPSLCVDFSTVREKV